MSNVTGIHVRSLQSLKSFCPNCIKAVTTPSVSEQPCGAVGKPPAARPPAGRGVRSRGTVQTAPCGSHRCHHHPIHFCTDAPFENSREVMAEELKSGLSPTWKHHVQTPPYPEGKPQRDSSTAHFSSVMPCVLPGGVRKHPKASQVSSGAPRAARGCCWGFHRHGSRTRTSRPAGRGGWQQHRAAPHGQLSSELLDSCRRGRRLLFAV